MRFAYARFYAALAVMSFALAAAGAEHAKEPLSKVKENVDEEKAVLVDVREKKEWDRGHVEGAIFLPLSRLRDGVTKDELEPLPQDKVLYVHCAIGQRALAAGNILEKYGYKVRPIKPGYKELISAGFSKAKDAP